MTEDQQRLGARLLAFAGLWLLLTGVLLALSFVVLGLISFAALLVTAVVVGTRWAIRHFQVGEAVTHGLVASTDAATRLAERRPHLELRGRLNLDVRRRVKRFAVAAPARIGPLLAKALRAYATAVYRLNAIGRRRQAFRLNARGAELRRRGNPVHAAEQHRVALEIVRDIGDVEAEALTLNSLGLALAQGGAETEAVEYLEHARDVLHALGDAEHEGHVIANLGLVYRRQGESEQASVLFQEALDRLPPGSTAYRQVMEELLRAS